MTRREIRRALVSVSDKTGLVELTRALTAAGVEIVSTGSTAATIADAGLPVVPVEQVTGFAECLDGRVKTLHPAIHAGILADVTNDEHVAALVELGIASFDLVVVNLYPFRETVASGAEDGAVVEMIDIGGPAMVRAAAKNHRCVAVVVDPADYDAVIDAVRQGGFTDPERRRLAGAAFAHTASYDTAVASYFGAGRPPSFFGVAYDSVESLRYGENPHQWAGVYRERDGIGLAGALQHGGKDMSYNNYVDADAALRAAFDFSDPAVAIIKHANPCGIAVGRGDDPIADAHMRANACDPLSAFGGVIAANRSISVAAARQIAEIFTEVVVAPGFDEGAIELLCARPGLRILQVASGPTGGVEWRRIDGGVLVQQPDRLDADGDDPAAWTLAAGEAVDAATLSDLVFAWRAVRAVRSNAILIADHGATVGIGMGQVNRVDAARLAVERSAGRAQGAVAASDAFFPFPDGLAILLDAGVRAVVQPGGSVRDPEVLDLARERGISMYLTGARHFTH